MTSWYDKPRDWGSIHNFNVEHLLLLKRKFENDPASVTKYSIDRNWLMGHAIPPFQRPVVWDEDRMIAFLETLVQKGDPGTYTYHTSDRTVVSEDGQEHYPRDMWLLDGQQRLTALDRFFDDTFPVFGLYWSEVDETRKRGFLMGTGFAAYEVRNKSELELRELYDLKNFGGIAHEEHQRAIPLPRP
ncbi:DUF262 domain-containing protein [Pararhizobium sp. BT-229]|uniref:DUF262 domain-containing protein n=1 Tax=Pararhizobium sp. BT-229 TaxID=2986923 RepID=UPI0021F7BD5F|nr:DUF262 domain-containing protein [Pararhizobium sp. BT-229]MCV9964595.1 DUF262 domain-containing protein [Pararhizobium sp. BT-229]